MKILQIRFKNLNSLVGEWKIDLTDPAYITTGIFAIVGPTGAGKSTILDAICLALYGQTPRLSSISQTTNEIMSRQTGECFAEVLFATQKGHFRCHWSQHKAQKRFDGQLQQPKHEIADVATGKVLESHIRKVAAHIESVTGMNFDRFTRSMLLAQGRFAAFLQASANERAPILEQITGTEIYTRISINVHERNKREQALLKELRAEIAGIEILDATQVTAIEADISATKDEALTLKQTQTTTQSAREWRKRIIDLENEITTLTSNLQELTQEMTDFQPQRRQLDRAMQAEALAGQYAELSTQRMLRIQQLAQLKENSATLENLTNAVHTQQQTLTNQAQKTTQAKSALSDATPKMRKVRELDTTCAGLKKQIDGYTDDIKKIDKNIKKTTKILSQAQKQQAEVHVALAPITRYLSDHAPDATLVSEFTGIDARFRTLQDKQQAVHNGAAHITAIQVEIADVQEKQRQQHDMVRALQIDETNATVALDYEKSLLDLLLNGRLLREYQADMQALNLEKGLRTTIANLEGHRAHLSDGQPCPLCGALEHPYAHGNIPALAEIDSKLKSLAELITLAESHESTINQRKTAEQDAQKKVEDATHEVQLILGKIQNLDVRLQEAHTQLENVRTDVENLINAMNITLAPFGVCVTAETTAGTIIATLQQRLAQWNNYAQQQAELGTQITELASKIQENTTTLTGLQENHGQITVRLTAVQSDYDTNHVERINLFGEANPDELEQTLNTAIADAEQAEKQANEDLDTTRVAFSTAHGVNTTLINNIAQLETTLAQLEPAFSHALTAKQFADEASFVAAQLAPEQREMLLTQATYFDNKTYTLTQNRQARAQALVTAQAKALTDQSLADLEQFIELIEQDQRAIDYRINDNQRKLHENTAHITLVQTKKSAIDAQEIACTKWGILDKLIGSADGKTYRNFAQGLTFEFMIDHANRQLQKMTDRYVLTRQSEQGLELLVIDNYHAGEIRSTKNLSGGESFIISLALALGLSQMASKNVRVDSLFLDEGFGTLDEEALETALDTLAGLQHEGKLIGIISHVAALKDRVTTQIQVTPYTGGKSRIEGPGCQG